MRKYELWSDTEEAETARLLSFGLGWQEVGEKIGRTAESVRIHFRRTISGREALRWIRESPLPRYDKPLTMEGDALILPDIELPFHHAGFINRCLDLAEAWGIRQAIVAGDFIHLDALSPFGTNWIEENHHGLSDKQEKMLTDFLTGLGSRQQARGFALLEEIGNATGGDPNLSEELRSAREVVRVMAKRFDLIQWVLGNHEGRMLKALKSPLFPSDLLRLLETGTIQWQTSPYYWSDLVSNGIKYRIEHPKSTGKNAAADLAAKYHVNVLMGHSHLLSVNWDISGEYLAIQMGHCCDEEREAYAAQRHTARRDPHKLGAVIVRGGYPWLLHEGCAWEDLRKIGAVV